MESFRLAADWGADVLFVHHGLFWSEQLRVCGGHYERLRFLMERGLSLYAVHLPLDMHPVVGNNAGLADVLGLVEREPFGLYKGFQIGVKGRFPVRTGREEVAGRLFGPQAEPLARLLPFGKAEVGSVGIVSGGAPFEALQAVDEGLDMYITGESSHSVYHQAQEAGLNILFAGHYQTETWGVRLVAEKTREDTGCETRFFDVPTGL
jgi:dinuclear metal center YbgI/SA1388 family protein